MKSKSITRRNFLVRSAAAAMAPYIIPGSALGKNGSVAPSNRIVIAAIGMGDRNKVVTGHFLKQQDVQCVAVCDCFQDRRKLAKIMVDTHYDNYDCVATRFQEEILHRKDIDAVVIATGDRWHAVLSTLAAKAGKDVYCEKPFTLTIAEGRAMVEVMKRYGTVWQCGTQRRSNESYHFVAQTVHNGLIGKLHTITLELGDGMQTNGFALPEPEPDPDVFDYNRWLGQAPWAPYSRMRVALWRQIWDTSGRVVCDMGPHYFDLAQWAHGSEKSGPVSFESTAVWPDDGFVQVPITFNIEARYADGVKIVVKNGPKGVRFDGDEGWIHILDEGEITAKPESILKTRSVPSVSWKFMNDHVRNFLDCTRSRKPTVSNPEIAQRNHSIVHCANICLRLGRKLQWNPETERFTDDDANALLSRAMRAPWHSA
jgi:predicted dehydrogenase